MITIEEEVHYDNRVVRCYQPRPSTVTQLLLNTLNRNPNGEALISGGSRMTYRELNQQIEALARGLHSNGIQKGDRVAILLSNRPEFVVSVLAAIRIEAIAVPLNVKLQTPELEYILTHCGAKLLVHDADVAIRLPLNKNLPTLEKRFAVGGDAEGSRAFSDLLQANARQLEANKAEEEDAAVILYTSGTTGRPKGAMLTHLGIVHSSMHFAECMRLNQDDVSVMAVPASHVTGLVANIMTMIYVGGATVLMQTFKARAFLELAQRERMTHTLIVPAMYNLCLLDENAATFDLSAWRIGGYGGAPMPEATIEKLAKWLPDLQLVNAYGATEVTSPATVMPLGKTTAHGDSVGRVVPCGELLIKDKEGQNVEPGKSGEIWIKGPMVVPGYWNNKQATQESFINGYWRSGDIGSIDALGYVRVFDRLKDVINRGGYKIYSVEVENALNHHPNVVESAVVAREDPVLGEKIAAFVCLSNSQTDAEDLKTFCAQRLSDYKIPDFVFFRDQPLARNAAGKLLKRELREELENDRTSLS